MEKQRVIIDTCFLEKLCKDHEKDRFCRVMDALNYKPMVHPYVYEHEWLFSYQKDLVQNGYVGKIEYDEFLPDHVSRWTYEAYFKQLYEELRRYLQANGSKKGLSQLTFRGSETIYSKHLKGSSMGDVHVMLMAFFMHIPIICTEDSDLSILRLLAAQKFDTDSFHLEIMNGVGLVKKVAESPQTEMNKKDLEDTLKKMGERSHCPEITALYRKSHE